MKIQIKTGCISDDVVIDGKSIRDLTEMETDLIIDDLIQITREKLRKNEISLVDLMDLFEYDSFECIDEPCDQCGDNAFITTYDLR